LIVINQLFDRRIVAADRASWIAPQLSYEMQPCLI
jgi:hypothetical protein